MIFDTVKSALAEFGASADSASAARGAAKKKNKEDYAGNLLIEKNKEADNAFSSAVYGSKAASLEKIRAEFAQLKAKAMEAATKAPTAEQLSILNAVKMLGSRITPAEAEVFIEKMNGCYIAKAALIDSLNQNGVKDASGEQYFMTRYENIANGIEEAKAAAENFILHYDSNDGLNNALFTTPVNHPFDKFETDLETFIDCEN